MAGCTAPFRDIDALDELCYHLIGYVSMVRTQIQLTEEQATRLKSVAAKRGVSMAELIRQAIEMLLDKGAEKSEVELRRRAIEAAGRFHSGKRNVARDHDGYLSEDFAG
jgi:Arc/MetJ-type ribon-helix-helix transcriptional regulator